MQVIPQDSDDMRETSSASLSTVSIPENDFLPAAEFPNFDSAAITPQKEIFENTAIGTQEDTFAGAERSNDARPLTVQAAQLINRDSGEDISPVGRPRFLGFVVPVVIVLLALGAASTLRDQSLTPKLGINAATDKSRASDSGSEKLSVDSVQTEQPDRNIQPRPRLTLEPNLSGKDGASIPLGIRVSGEAPGLAMEIGGLPEGMTISPGRALGTGAWRLLAPDIAEAMINPPPGFAGAIDLTVELRLADDTVTDHGSLHREWPRSPDGPTASVALADTVSANSADQETRAATRPNRNAVRSAAAANAVKEETRAAISPNLNAVSSAADSRLDPAQVDLLIKRSQAFVSEGDVVSARVQLRRAAEARDARAALALGATYDPIMLAILQVHGVAADVFQARYWYKKAKEFGSAEASQRLKLLETVRP
jgi:hypothetical protein